MSAGVMGFEAESGIEDRRRYRLIGPLSGEMSDVGAGIGIPG
jgi:hypothetical protein